MRSADSEKIDVQALLREEADPYEEASMGAINGLDEEDQTELASLTEQHEILRRQVALLRARIAERDEKNIPGVDASWSVERTISLGTVAVGLIALGTITVWASRNR